MRRILVLLAVTALLLVALALPAFAAATGDPSNPSCLGNIASVNNDPDLMLGAPGDGGQLVGAAGQTGNLGTSASSNCGFGYP